MENPSFEYTYSAQQKQEVEAIRKKYLPKEEDKRLKLADGGEHYIFATTVAKGEKVLVVCKKA